jgi:hypothetical protein
MYHRSNMVFRIIDSFFRHRRLFLLSVLVITTTVVSLLLTRSKTYVATATTKVMADTELHNALGYYQTSWVTPAQQNVNRFNDLMRDNKPGGFVDKFLKRAKLAQPISVDPNVRDPRLGQLYKKLSAFAVSDELFSITLVWEDPEECKRIVQAVQAQYIEAAGHAKTATAIETSEFLDLQINKYLKEMQQAERALTDYKMKNAGMTPEAQAAEIGRLSDLKQELDILKITAKDNALKRQAIEARLKDVNPTAILSQTVTQSPTARHIDRLLDERANELKTHLPESQTIKDIDDRIAELKAYHEKEIQEALKRQSVAGSVEETKLQDNPEFLRLSEQLTTARIDEQTHTARMRLLKEQIAEYEARVSKIPAAQRELTEKTRRYEINRDRYQDLVKKREDARIKTDMELVAATSTYVPMGVIHPESTLGMKKKAILIAGSLILGLLVGTMLVVASEWADPTLRYEADAERMLGVPVLMALPENKEILSLPEPSEPSGWRRLLPGQRER